MAASFYEAEDDADEHLDDWAADVSYLARRHWLLYQDTAELLLWWEAYEARHNVLRAVELGEDVEQARAAVDRSPGPPTALEGLEANRKLVELLELRRWYVIQDAHEAGASWTEIGAALGITKQGAHDWYRRAIAKRAEIDQDHNTERAEQAF